MKTLTEKAEFALIMAIVVAICLGIFMLYLDYKYKAELLLTPCELCSKLNPHLDRCFADASTIVKDNQGNIIGYGRDSIPIGVNVSSYTFEINWTKTNLSG